MNCIKKTRAITEGDKYHRRVLCLKFQGTCMICDKFNIFIKQKEIFLLLDKENLWLTALYLVSICLNFKFKVNPLKSLRIMLKRK